jgi:hypothetical protein
MWGVQTFGNYGNKSKLHLKKAEKFVWVVSGTDSPPTGHIPDLVLTSILNIGTLAYPVTTVRNQPVTKTKSL